MTLLPRHERELVIGSGIDPAVIARRGYRSITAAEAAALGFAPTQAKAGLFLPTHALAGVQIGGLLKPDEPRLNEQGKPLKYEAPAGSVPMLDIHPGARHLLEDPTQPLWFTEGHKKADAAWSHGLPCVALTGVYMFLHQRYVVPDLDDINLRDRDCRIAFDSDATRKRSVADARLRFAEALRRRGAKVSVVYLPEAPGGAKVGLDDFFVGGGTVAEIEALTRPWDGNGPGIWLRSAGDVDPEELSATCTALMQAILNPENTRAELMLMAATASLAMHKQARGETEPDGRVVLNAAEIADDYRPEPEPGQHVAPINPNGTKPRMARGTVKPAIAKAVESGRLRAEPRPVTRQHRNGTSYRDTEWVIEPAASLAALIDPWARYRLTAPKLRKPRAITPECPHCGEVHPTRQVDYCAGCGAAMRERTIAPIFADESASDNFSEAENLERPLPQVPSSTVRSFIGGGADAIDEPGWLAAAMADEDSPDNLSEPPRPDLRQAQARIETASHAAGDEAREALHELGELLAAGARAQSRTPVPKPNDPPRRPDRILRATSAREDLAWREREYPTGPCCVECGARIAAGTGFYCAEHGGAPAASAPSLPGFDQPTPVDRWTR
jgi:Domain of unknown function (DUF3854)